MNSSVEDVMEEISNLYEIHETKLKRFEKLVSLSVIKQEEFEEFKRKGVLHCRTEAEKLMSPYLNDNLESEAGINGESEKEHVADLRQAELDDSKALVSQLQSEVSELKMQLALSKSLNDYMIEQRSGNEQPVSSNNHSSSSQSHSSSSDVRKVNIIDHSSNGANIYKKRRVEPADSNSVELSAPMKTKEVKAKLAAHVNNIKHSHSYTKECEEAFTFLEDHFYSVAAFHDDFNVLVRLARLFVTLTDNLPETNEIFKLQRIISRIIAFIAKILSVYSSQRTRRVRDLLAVTSFLPRLIAMCPKFVSISKGCVTIFEAIAVEQPNKLQTMLDCDIMNSLDDAFPGTNDVTSKLTELLKPSVSSSQLDVASSRQLCGSVSMWDHSIRTVPVNHLVWAPVYYLANRVCCGVICGNHVIVSQSDKEPAEGCVVVELFNADKEGRHTRYLVVNESDVYSYNGNKRNIAYPLYHKNAFGGEHKEVEWNKRLLDRMHDTLIDKYRQDSGDKVFDRATFIANDFLRLAINS